MSKSGRSLGGSRILRTRSSLLRTLKLPNVSYSFRLTTPLVISTFRVTPLSFKMLTLMLLPSGGMSYLPTLARQKIFSLTYFYGPSAPTWYLRSYASLTLVGIVRQFRKVSNLELLPGSGMKYARSAGSWCRITGRDFTSCTAVAYLPSGVRKVVSLLSTVLPGRAAALDKRDSSNTRSGY